LISHLWSFKQEKKIEVECDEIVAINSSETHFFLAIVHNDEFKVYELTNFDELEKLEEEKVIYKSKEPIRRLVSSSKFLLVVKEAQNSAIFDVNERKMHELSIATDT